MRKQTKINVATAFVQKLIDEDFKMAVAYLSPEFRQQCSADYLQQKYSELTEFFEKETTAIDFDEVLEAGNQASYESVYQYLVVPVISHCPAECVCTA